jgi:phosphoserine aminotransferase
MICTTLNETSTGVMISKLCEMKGDTLLAVDATSGAGQIPCDISQTDIFFFSPQKVFASEGGTFVAIMSPKAIARAKEIAVNKDRYYPDIMDWRQAIDNSEKNQTYNTPSVTTLFLLNEQVKEMNKLGFEKVVKMAQAKANFLYAWAESKEYLKPYIVEEEFRSIAVATIDLDDKYNVDDLLQVLSSQKAAFDIDGYRKLGRNQFRISLFHNVTLENLQKLTQIISHAVESHA